ncbi:DUF4240 domain-containing protein [Streptomyces uncialis]|uniref:DUF4240 domain-containing protein n=1 Tax=Streptomyces uncialis TaxID=1048205 RepID=UPI0037976572
MNTDTFWAVIEVARSEADDTDRPLDEILTDHLSRRVPDEIVAYAARFDAAESALYRWDIWAAAFLIGGGCSDDSFEDFRAAVIALGRQWHQRVVADPDSLAGHPLVCRAAERGVRPEALFYEGMNWAAGRAFHQATGVEDAFYDALDELLEAEDGDRATEDMGEDFNFGDGSEMHRRLPRLAALFLPPARS